jgi:uncharacterized membrane protein
MREAVSSYSFEIIATNLSKEEEAKLQTYFSEEAKTVYNRYQAPCFAVGVECPVY